MASPPLELLIPLWDFDIRVPERRGLLLADGESIPFRKESATTALKDEESGDINGPGVKRAMERLGRVEGRLGVDGFERCASEGRRGDDIVFPCAWGLARLSSDCQGFSSRGDAMSSLRPVNLDDAVDV